jgi:hypothetical protein
LFNAKSSKKALYFIRRLAHSHGGKPLPGGNNPDLFGSHRNGSH